MEIIIFGTNYTLRQSFRAIIMWEQALHKPFAPSNTYEMLVYFYCCIVGNYPDLDLPFDAFMAWIDEHPHLVSDFAQWVARSNSNDIFNDNKVITDEEKKRTGNR